MAEARAFWIAEAGRGELRRERVGRPGRDEVLIEAVASGISRGTESLVFRGEVPASQHQAMRAPFQAGELGFPVKYGYSSVGMVAEGSASGFSRSFITPVRFEMPAGTMVHRGN